MQMLFDLVPVILFLLAFKFYDIYAATMVGIIATSIQVLATRCIKGKYDNMQLFVLSVFMVFGGLTLFYHNPIFVRWKPTVVFWVLAIAVIITQTFTDKSIMQRMMERAIQFNNNIPPNVWRNINFLWTAFYIIMGCLNLYFAYYFSENAWVNFKAYGITSATFIVAIIQTVLLNPYISEKETTK